MVKKIAAKKVTMKTVSATAAPRYLLRPVHIENGLLANGRENFQTRLADLVNWMKKEKKITSIKTFAEFVTSAREDGETTRLTYQDMTGYLYNGITAKSNKVALICRATGLPREYFEDFSRTKTQILKDMNFRV